MLESLDVKKATLAASAAVLLSYVGLVAWGSHSERVAAAALKNAGEMSARNLELADIAALRTQERDDSHRQNVALQQRVDDLLKARPKPPPRPGAAPTTEPELAAGLVSRGLFTGLVVLDLPHSTLATVDARKVYSWEAEASRVPAFESKAAADDAIILAQTAAADGLRREAAQCSEVVQLKDRQIAVLGKEVGVLRVDHDAQLKVQAAEVWKTRIKLAVGIPIAAYLGWRIGRD